MSNQVLDTKSTNDVKTRIQRVRASIERKEKEIQKYEGVFLFPLNKEVLVLNEEINDLWTLIFYDEQQLKG